MSVNVNWRKTKEALKNKADAMDSKMIYFLQFFKAAGLRKG